MEIMEIVEEVYMQKKEQLRLEILDKVKEYYNLTQEQNQYKEGDKIFYSGRIYNAEEMVNLVDAALEFWLTSGHFASEFELGLANFLDAKFCSLVNSGSSANLCAFMALTSPE